MLGLTDAVRTDAAKTREAGRGSIAITACMALMAFGLIADRVAAQQPEAAKPAEGEATEAPVAKVAVASPCAVKRAGGSLGTVDGWIAVNAAGVMGEPWESRSQMPPRSCLPRQPRQRPRMLRKLCPIRAEPPAEAVDFFKRFLTGPADQADDPQDKAWLAARNVMDPFNALTILFSSAITIGTNSHSAYGPGMPGFARNVGVSFTQDMTGEFFNTFLIPSIVHQDPHYHRMAHGSIPRRACHAALQVLWTQGDNGKGMVNYGNLVGFGDRRRDQQPLRPGAADESSRQSERYAIGIASSPIDNFVSEFVPDVASHIHVQVVVIQRIINQVAKTGGAGSSP